jgi:large subunit ribosomal protein L11
MVHIMGETTLSAMVEGGKASGGPPLGPALGPLGIPVNSIIDEINKKTKAF